jgi:thiol-disulfide isomerase/thioredoxin
MNPRELNTHYTAFRCVATLFCAILAVQTALGAAEPSTNRSPAALKPGTFGDWPAPLGEALKRARRQHAQVVIDFHASWCMPCVAMAQNVLNGPEWKSVQHEAVGIDLDVDSPEGAYWEHRFASGLPSVVVLSETGSELGRIEGLQKREDFYRKLQAIMEGRSALDTLRAKVVGSDPASVEAAIEVLITFLDREAAVDALAWKNSLPPTIQGALHANQQAQMLIARLRFLQAVQTRDAAQCLALGKVVLTGDLGCDRPQTVMNLMACTEGTRSAARTTLLVSQKEPLRELLVAQVFVTHPTCASAEDAVGAMHFLSKELGDAKEATHVLEEAIDDVEKRGGNDIVRNKSLANELSTYLAVANKSTELDALYARLIAAYPDDYTYQLRFGEILASRGQYKRALPLLETAAGKAYGANMLRIAKDRTEILLKLGRAAEARQIATDALKEDGAWFPDLAAELRAMIVR